MRLRWLAPLAVALVSAGCINAEGGIDGPAIDDPVTNEDTGAAAMEDTNGVTEDADDTGSPSTTDSSTGSDTKPSTDTGTAVTDSGKPPADTGAPPTDSGMTGGWPATNAEFEAQILAEVNKRRVAGASCGAMGTFAAVPPLVMHPQLQSAARKHSKDMATNNFFAHDNLAGLSPFDRMKAEGYKGGTMGENIAAGNATAAITMDQWMKSDGHCANIMNKSYTQLGVGYFYNASSTYRHYWTQNFGAGG